MLTLCTLFDHNYLDKALAMYESLEKVCGDFELYVLAMSDECYDILVDLNYPHIKPIRLTDFEDDELLRVKPTRNVGEYCWTCSSSLIRYVLLTYKPKYCAYVDSDLYFYSNPRVVIDEMENRGASVQITGHRFNEELKYLASTVGTYCVEYNTFKNDDKALKLLEIWRSQCLEHCSIDGDGIHWGDQKYMDDWCDKYDFVIETNNMGMGVAPWNVKQYKFLRVNDTLSISHNGVITPLVFYHFQGIKYLNRIYIHMGLYDANSKRREDVRFLYRNYLKKVEIIKALLQNRYLLDVVLTKHLGCPTPVYSLKERIKYAVTHPLVLVKKLRILDLQMLLDKDIVKI